MRIRRTDVAAAVWGILEATVFFIVPDVFLSWVALKDGRKAMRACAWTVLGALVGGAIIWYCGATNPEPVRELFTSLPAIGDGMIANVRSQLESAGLVALFIGPLIGTPYKIYALEAAHLGVGLLPFLLVSIPARIFRFVIVAGVANLASRILQKFVSVSTVRVMHIAVWTGFYAFYFFVMSEF